MTATAHSCDANADDFHDSGKKLKKKLEDLEARAASAPPSPPELHHELEAAVGDLETLSDKIYAKIGSFDRFDLSVSSGSHGSPPSMSAGTMALGFTDDLAPKAPEPEPQKNRPISIDSEPRSDENKQMREELRAYKRELEREAEVERIKIELMLKKAREEEKAQEEQERQKGIEEFTEFERMECERIAMTKGDKELEEDEEEEERHKEIEKRAILEHQRKLQEVESTLR